MVGGQLVFGFTNNVKRSFTSARREAGLPDVRFHDLRRTPDWDRHGAVVAGFANAISESRINRFTFQRQHTEDAFVYPSQGLALNKSLQAFHPQGKLSQSQRTLG